ncbi:hypothetical protein IV79_GL000991 [Pediococcus claussenii]|nr:polysaccharide biosynthesis protein [Pediococcus claussenii]ANZ70524.1 sugar transporter [Pediococcus claussenii]ANZ72338.1 sugar transporter [Pediococcus claussenii]KRN19704.1 hypothetical protein IV79_GL000991 [Pediococcus claussenii]
MRGAMVLSLASLIAKILSAIYRIPLQNLVGNTGFYVYQQVYPIYGIGMTFALSGFPIFISKIIAEQPSEKERWRINFYSFLILVIISIAFFLAIFCSSHLIAVWMGDSQLTPLLKAVSFMFLFMPLLAAGRGYYQGIYDVVPTALSQVVEQFVRVAVIIAVAVLATKLSWNVYFMGKWAMASSSIAAVFSSLFFLQFGRKLLAKIPTEIDFKKLGHLFKRFVIEGGLVCLMASMIILLQLVDSFTVKNGLVSSGVSNEAAKGLKGVFDRAQPLVQLGVVIATSFGAALLPSLTRAVQKRNQVEFYRSAVSLIRVSTIISVAASLGMIAIMPEINVLLFGDTSGSSSLAIYNLSIIFSALIFVYNSVLQSINRLRATFFAVLAGLLVKIALNSWFVQRMGINGASIVTVLSLMTVAIAMGVLVPRQINQRVYVKDGFIFKLIFGAGIMTIVVGSFATVLTKILPLTNRAVTMLNVIISIVIGVTIFAVYVFKAHLLSVREWLVLPYGKQALKFIQRIGK